MKYLLYTGLFALTLINQSCLTSKQHAAACVPSNLYTVPMDSLTDFQKVSYAVGHTVASDMKKNGLDTLDFNYLKVAFQDVFIGDTNRLTEAATQQLLRSLTDSLRRVQQTEQMKKYEGNKKVGADFMESLKSNDSIKFTASGLAYKVTREGNGAFPKATDNVTAHYEGRLIDGTIFDSSYPRGNPAQFPLTRVIKGWTEGLQYINEGGAIELYIPYNLAYGENGSGAKIPPYSTLIFKVELVEVSDAHKGHNHGPGGHQH